VPTIWRHAGRGDQPGDMVVCLGAGDITKWAAGLAPAIAERKDSL
jgi:UDP-N-acetylmuramate--alanine ligase